MTNTPPINTRPVTHPVSRTQITKAVELIRKTNHWAQKDVIVSHYTGGATTRLREMDSPEWTAMCAELKRRMASINEQRAWVLDQARRIGWVDSTGKADICRINQFFS